MTQVINQEIQVNAVYFAGRELRTFPREIEYSGQAVTFSSGLRYLLRRDGQTIRLFDMRAEDGLVYRLENDGQRWKLLRLKTEGALA